MTGPDDDASLARIEATRRVLRSALAKCAERGGATAEELAIAALYAAFDIAEQHAGPEAGAVEWLRTGCDTLERGIMEGVPRRG
ncbi:hypothetical protein [Erythrobacter sp. A6_0]|uniref:hypothetical protein n=1 Tax=Erythrobacter sp. A6_0 TaxID=2821089 RepID=UPI001ADCBFF5|nr:hypothetical protein [Erythrobacter sp. A6_0]MBO9510926.1 hypothetical protein [Erythrobacter sp. A6_0]